MADFTDVRTSQMPNMGMTYLRFGFSKARPIGYQESSRPKFGQVWPHSRMNARPGDQYITIRSYEGEALRWFTGED